jgi:hypothetical protein
MKNADSYGRNRLESKISKIINDLRSSLILGWGVLELTESVQKVKTEEN